MNINKSKNIKIILKPKHTTSDKINLNQSINLKECFICLETDDYVCNLSSLNKLYWTKCVCKGEIHFSCLHKWLYVKKRCPLCYNLYTSKVKWVFQNMIVIIFNLTKCFLFIIVFYACYNIIIHDTILYG
jgi:hypothetical protein